MKHEIEAHPRLVDAEQGLSDHEVARAGDGEELGDPLKDREEEKLRQRFKHG